MHKIKRNDGFTLLEIIISIAALSIISVFILQMFMVSSNLNKRARDVDFATAETVSRIESFKSGQIMPGLTEDASTTFFFYDKDWIYIESDQADLSNAPSGTTYYIRMGISVDEDFSALESGGLYVIEADAFDISSEGDERTLVSLRSKKYLPSIRSSMT